MVSINNRPENKDEAFFAVEGGLFSCPLDATVEYGANAALPTTAVFHGIVSADGAVVSESLSTTDHRGWQGSRVYRKSVDSADVTIALSLIQYNDANSELYFGKAKNATTGGYHYDAATLGQERQFFIIAIDTKTNEVIKQYVPQGQVTVRGDRSMVATAAVQLSITLTAYTVEIAGEAAQIVEWKETLNAAS